MAEATDFSQPFLDGMIPHAFQIPARVICPLITYMLLRPLPLRFRGVLPGVGLFFGMMSHAHSLLRVDKLVTADYELMSSSLLSAIMVGYR